MPRKKVKCILIFNIFQKLYINLNRKFKGKHQVLYIFENGKTCLISAVRMTKFKEKNHQFSLT